MNRFVSLNYTHLTKYGPINVYKFDVYDSSTGRIFTDTVKDSDWDNGHWQCREALTPYGFCLDISILVGSDCLRLSKEAKDITSKLTDLCCSKLRDKMK